MKRKDLIDLFLKNGWKVLREGGNHTVLAKGKWRESIPRHREVRELLAKSLIKHWQLKE